MGQEKFVCSGRLERGNQVITETPFDFAHGRLGHGGKEVSKRIEKEVNYRWMIALEVLGEAANVALTRLQREQLRV